jgi:hypothetical protein
MELSQNLAALTSVASAIASGAAAIAAWTVSTRVARRQIGEARINALRDDLSEIFAVFVELHTPSPETLSSEEEIRFRLEKGSRARFLNQRIRLRLSDPDEPSSRELLELITQLADPSRDMELETLLPRGHLKAREVLKAEWKRAKAGR